LLSPFISLLPDFDYCRCQLPMITPHAITLAMLILLPPFSPPRRHCYAAIIFISRAFAT
jgi:hypothetical protein